MAADCAEQFGTGSHSKIHSVGSNREMQRRTMAPNIPYHSGGEKEIYEEFEEMCIIGFRPRSLEKDPVFQITTQFG